MNKRVLVAMSGGIDSTVAALLLHKQGYDVVGITMKTWDYSDTNAVGKETGCCNLDSFNDARQVAVDCGFAHYILDIREEFTESVVQNFIDEYIAGRTPNPCVLCNTHIKWNALLKKANALNCDWIATGHYATIQKSEGNRYYIVKGKDETKDQSYVLWGLEQEVLARTILPLGNYLKTEIRQMAFDFGYQALSKKAESYEICFIPDNDYRKFLKSKVENLEENLKGGKFIDKYNKVLGEHSGYPFYTIGQRRGVNVALGKPVYVTEIDAEQNTVTIGDLEDLQNKKMLIRNINFMKFPKWENSFRGIVKIRYHNAGELADITVLNENVLQVHFLKPVISITPGQSAVVYDGNGIVAGGIIELSNKN